MKHVLDEVREAADPKKLKRVDFLGMQDLRNIRRDYGITYLTRMHQEDSVSVQVLVQMLQKLEKSPILDYVDDAESETFTLTIMTEFQVEMLRKFGEDKILIDGTHGLNAYEIQLFSLVVVDEFGNGVPVAFCFSKKYDKEAMVHFFEKVKESVGAEIKTSVFMSDGAPQFYQAWAHVMGECEFVLLCWWHVSKNWMTNSHAKIKNEEKRKLVDSELRTLATSCLAPDEFERCLQRFISKLENDSETKTFYDYFITNYYDKRKMWAFSYRTFIGLNTNMYLENLHKRIKYLYLNGVACLRMDVSINALFHLVRDLTFDRMIKVAKSKASNKILRIRRSHTQSLQMSDADVCEDRAVGGWTVKSATSRGHYWVQKVADNCPQKLCLLECRACCACVHTFRCSCPDNTIYLNVCKHIHKVGQQMGHGPVITTPGVERIRQDVVMETQECLSAEIELTLARNCKTSIRNKLESIQRRIGETDVIDDADARLIERKLDAVLLILKKNTCQKKDIAAVVGTRTSRKKIEPQRSNLVRKKKKKRKEAKLLPIPSAAQLRECIKSLHGEDSLHIHTGYDHTYASTK